MPRKEKSRVQGVTLWPTCTIYSQPLHCLSPCRPFSFQCYKLDCSHWQLCVHPGDYWCCGAL